MNITTHIDKEIYTIFLDGDLDAFSSGNMDKALLLACKSMKPHIWIDCRNLNYISSSGLGIVLYYMQQFKDNKQSLVLFNMSSKVKDVFQILGIDVLLTILPSREEALQLVK
jgi:anti-sigma B factor antagonist